MTNPTVADLIPTLTAVSTGIASDAVEPTPILTNVEPVETILTGFVNVPIETVQSPVYPLLSVSRNPKTLFLFLR